VELVAILDRWGVALVFAAVLAELGGLPVPAAPLLVAAGALSMQDTLRPDAALASALAAALIADHAWFFVGRRHGRRILDAVCRISLSPDTCVSRTDALIARHGPALLLFAKFIPGVSAVSIPTIAAMGVSWRRFVLYDVLGCLVWCGGYIGAGAIFNRQIDRVFDSMQRVGGGATIAVVALIALYVGAKLLHRRRLVRLHRLVRISPEEVAERLDAGEDFVILDARSQVARTSDPRELPRSITLRDPTDFGSLPAELRARTIITFCTCPNEASAAFVAEALIKAGFGRVHVLTGGTDALDLLSPS